MKKKLFGFMTAFLLLCLCAVIPAFAAGNEYYLVDGRVYSDGTAEINRVDIVENVPTVNLPQGDADSYVLAALNEDYEIIEMFVLGVNFELSADAGGGYSEYSEFSALIPYDSQIYAFFIIDGDYEILAEAYLEEAVQSEILYFNVEESDGGYNLEWAVELYDDDYAYLLEYDVMTVSKESGETNLLAYRTDETNLFVPYGWLDPNDTVVFTLKSNDSRTTLTAVSEEISTPAGDEKIIADNDTEWGEIYGGGEDENSALLYIVIAAAAVIVISITVIVIVFVKKKKK